MSCCDLGSKPKGSRPTFEMNFTDVITGEPADPVAISVTTKDPNGAGHTYSIADPEVYQRGTPIVGEWFFTFPAGLTVVGHWFVYANGDGQVQEATFTITGVNVTV